MFILFKIYFILDSINQNEKQQKNSTPPSPQILYYALAYM